MAREVARLVTLVGIAAADSPHPIPSVTLGRDVHNAPVKMPLVGQGTWQYNNTVAYDAVCEAFKAGYTFVDTALGYGNQKGVGKAIKDCWKGSREDLFVMTKMPGGLNTTEVQQSHEQNMRELGLDYVDHLMFHFPADWQATPERANPKRRQEGWKALEAIYRSGQARSIGLSHYCPKHIDDILAVAEVRPTVNQVEYHVGSGDVDGVIEKCQNEGIYFMSFSPLCGPCDYEPKDSLINGRLVAAIAKKHNVTGSQVSLRWIVQQALHKDFIAGVIPKSDKPAHLALNLDVFSFNLDHEEMAALAAATEPKGTGGDCDVTDGEGLAVLV